MKRGHLLLIFFLAFTPLLAAQDATGKIAGTVSDQQGAVISGAVVTVTNVATQVRNRVVTGSDGAYQVLQLPIGTYHVAAERPGFRTVSAEAHTLQINQALRLDLVLPVGSSTETVEVSGAAAGVETYNSTLGNSVTSRPIINLPLNGRDVLDLARLEPGVTEQNPGNGAAGNFSISGARTDSVNFLLDGGVNNNLLDNSVVFNPNPDTIEEFRILESNYSSEFGRNAGGIISVVTKSGTNALHGSAFDYVRNEAFDANSFFNNYQGVPREVLRRQQFGGTIGGPIIKDKAFFFGGYQGQRQNEQVHPAQGSIVDVFTSRELNGDFSASPDAAGVASFLQANPYYQADPVQAAAGTIDPSAIDPVAQNYIAAGLVPSSANGSLPMQASQKTNFDELTGKFDFNLTSNDRFNATLGLNRAPGTRPFAGGASVPFTVNDDIHTYFLNLSYNKTINPTLLNEIRFTAQRVNAKEGAPASKMPTGPDLGISITPDLATGPTILYFVNSGLTLGFSYRGPLTKVNNSFGFSDAISWVKNRHTLKAGFTFSPYQNNTIYAYEVNGEFDLYGSTTGSDFADFLIGSPDEYIQFGNAPSNIRSKSYYGYLQDEWRVTRRLVLNLGVRYEYSSPKIDTLGRSFSFKWGAQSQRFVNAPPGLLFPGDPGAPRGANFPDRNDFAPRFGFAWDPKGDGKTSVRGGFGVFYDILKGEDNLQFNGQAPFFGFTDIGFDPWASAGPSPYMADPYGSTDTPNPFPSKPPTRELDFDAAGFLPFGGSSVYFVDPHLRTPYVYQYNLSVQRELSKALRLDMSYVGSTAHKLTSLVDMNPFPNAFGETLRINNTQPGALSYSYSYMDTFRNVGDQSYNGLQTALRKQISGGSHWYGSSYFTLAYTWAKNIDTASGFRENNTRVKYYQPGADRAVSDMDVAHTVTFSGGWDLPFHNWWTSAPKTVTQGWSVYPIITWRTGFPIDIRGFLSRSRRNPGPSCVGDQGLVRPNLVGSSVQTLDPHANLNQAGALYFSPDNFDTTYPDGSCTYGTLTRNYIRGLGRTNVDFAIGKTTPLGTERAKLEFRLEFFNLLNSTQFSDPYYTNPTEPDTFGRITSTADPRIIQLGARITF